MWSKRRIEFVSIKSQRALAMVVPDQLRGAIAHDEECSIVREADPRFCLGLRKGQDRQWPDLRIIKPFALAYIAERIARDAGRIDDYWGNTGRAIANAYRQYFFQVALC